MASPQPASKPDGGPALEAETAAAAPGSEHVLALGASRRDAPDAPEPRHAGLVRRVLRETLSFSVIETIGQIFSWVSNLLLARLLLPKDFGIYDICGSFIMMGCLLGDGGLGASLVRKPTEPTADDYESVFVSTVTVGSVLAIGFSVAAPLLARAYHLEGRAVWVLVAMAPGYLLGSLRTYPMVRLERDLRFATMARIDLAVLFFRQGTAITLAFLGKGVWALVASNIGSSLFATAATFAVMRGIPRFRFHRSAFGTLLSYGMKVQGLTIVAFFKDNLSNILLGALAGPVAVAFFNRGVGYIQVPVLAVNAMAKIQFPTYARLQNDKDALYRVLRGALRLTFLLGVPFLVVLGAGSSWLLPLMFSEKWRPAIPVAWAMLINMVGGLAASPLFTLLQARNEAGLALGTFIAWTTSTWILAGIAYAFGLSLPGIGAAYSLVTTAVTLALLIRTGRHLERSLLPAIAPPVLAGLAAVGVHVLTRLPVMPAFLSNPIALMGIPLAVFVLVELGLEGATVVSELRGLIRSTRMPADDGAGSALAETFARDDALTERILERVLRPESNAVDVGCNAGQILRHMVRLAPRGRHHAFEPIPTLARDLRRRFPRVAVHEVALAEERGNATFHHVTNDSGYSGLRIRRYDRPDPEIEPITVRTDTLDALVPEDVRISFVKIDVEGGELGVLRGARKTLERGRPHVLFEHGRGASEFYGTTPELVYAFLVDECGYGIRTLSGWLESGPPLSLAELRRIYDEGRAWNFIASPIIDSARSRPS